LNFNVFADSLGTPVVAVEGWCFNFSKNVPNLEAYFLRSAFLPGNKKNQRASLRYPVPKYFLLVVGLIELNRHFEVNIVGGLL